MKTLLFISLGSDFSPTLETELPFLNELSTMGYEIQIYSIDKKNLPKDSSTNQFSTTRISIELTKDNIEGLVKNIIKNEKKINGLIIMDGLDFKSSSLGDKMKQLFEKNCDKSILEIATCFHYVTPKYENPTFNNQSLSQAFNFQEFSLLHKDLIELTKDERSLEHLKRVDLQISNQIKSGTNPLLLVNNFMNSEGFKRVFNTPKEARQKTLDLLTIHVCKQITLEKIGIDNQLDQGKNLVIGNFI